MHLFCAAAPASQALSLTPWHLPAPPHPKQAPAHPLRGQLEDLTRRYSSTTLEQAAEAEAAAASDAAAEAAALEASPAAWLPSPGGTQAGGGSSTPAAAPTGSRLHTPGSGASWQPELLAPSPRQPLHVVEQFGEVVASLRQRLDSLEAAAAAAALPPVPRTPDWQARQPLALYCVDNTVQTDPPAAAAVDSSSAQTDPPSAAAEAYLRAAARPPAAQPGGAGAQAVPEVRGSCQQQPGLPHGVPLLLPPSLRV